jgi:integrase
MKVKGIVLRGNIYWYERMVDGKRFRVSLDTSDLNKAISKANELRRKGPIKNDDSLSVLSDRWTRAKLAEEEWTEKTGKWAKNVMSQFVAFCGDRRAASVTEEQVKNWFSALRSEQEMSQAGRASYIRAVKAFFNWCVSERFVAHNPAVAVKLPRLGKAGSRSTFCTKELRDKLIKNAPNDDLRFVLFAGFHAGLRKLEIIEARRDWFDLEHDTLWVRKADRGNKRLRKGEKPFKIKDRDERPIPIRQAFAEFLKGYLNRELQPLDFVLNPEVPHGKSEYRWDFKRPFEEYMEAQGCPHVTPHMMRRTFASLLVQDGKSIYKVAKWLGDSVAVASEHYGHLSAKDRDIEEEEEKKPEKPEKRKKKAPTKKPSKPKAKAAAKPEDQESVEES